MFKRFLHDKKKKLMVRNISETSSYKAQYLEIKGCFEATGYKLQQREKVARWLYNVFNENCVNVGNVVPALPKLIGAIS